MAESFGSILDIQHFQNTKLQNSIIPSLDEQPIASFTCMASPSNIISVPFVHTKAGSFIFPNPIKNSKFIL